MTTHDDLPPLPAPDVTVRGYGPGYSTADGDGGAFTADAMRDYARQVLAMQWRPLETAPKDNRKVILSYLNRNSKPRTVIACWLTDEQAAEIDADGVGLEGGWFECIDNWDDFTEIAIHEGDPDHWMPLPSPPAAAPQAPAQPAKTEKTALERFVECEGDKEPDPLERLRFFCSLAMNGQDWLDIEPFFDSFAPHPARQPLTGATKVDPGFRWDGEHLCHIPTLLVEFEPVPENSPNDSKGWADRDAMARAILAAAQQQDPKA